MYRKKRRSWTKHVDFMLLDVLCMQLAFVISYIIRFGTDNPYTDGDYRTLAIAFLFIDFFVEIVSDSFKNVLKRGYFDEFIATCRHVILVELIVTFYLFTTQTGSFYSRFSYYIMVPFYIVTDYAARVIWKKILQKTGFNSAKKSLLIIAPEKILRETLQIVSADRRGYAKVTAVSLDTDLKGKNICGIPIVADRDGIIEYACGEWVDEVFIPPCAESEYPNELVRAFLEMGIAVHTGITKSGSFPAGCQQVEKIGVYTVITTSMNYAESSKLLVKRLMDIAGGLVGCLITLLITIIVGPMIYISSPGPIFFAQERIGRNGRKFKMYKFRSMYMDAEERKKELMAQNKISDGLMFKMDFDPRIIGNKILPDGTRKTGIGQFIRKTSLDEFPQFINILLGDMSLVGTRPPTVDEWELYEPHHRARMSFRPGLTGMWQVSGRSNITDFEEVVKLDTQYILPFRVFFKLARCKISSRFLAGQIFYQFLYTPADCIIRIISVVTISERCVKSLEKVFPECSSKIRMLYNISSTKMIWQLAEKNYPDEYRRKKNILVSIGRLNTQKGFDLAIQAAKIIEEKGVEFTWFIIGEGEDEQMLREQIKKERLNDSVKLIGIRKNPYPYIRYADVFVQPSRYEGKSIVLDEAKILCKPIVVTDYTTVVDSITDGVNGRIVQFDPNAIANGILELLNSDAQTKFETSLKGEIVRENLEVGNYIKLFIEMD